MRPSIGLVALVLAVSFASIARAQDNDDQTSWEDPSLEEALAVAKVIVRGKIDEKPDAGATVLVVDDVIAGDGVAKGTKVRLKNAVNTAAAQFLTSPKAGDDTIAILDAPGAEETKPNTFLLPSATFGRFVVREGKVAGCVRDSFVRAELKPEDYLTFLKNAWAKAKGQKPDAAWVTAQREALAKVDATATDGQAAHVGLEALCLAPDPKDAEGALRFFASPIPNVRVSAARLLERAGGERAADGLLRLAVNDTDPSVRSVAVAAVVKVKPQPKDAVKELVAHARDASAASILLHARVDDPRTNELPSPLAATFDALRQLGAEKETTPIAVDLLGRDDADTVSQAALQLAMLGPEAPVSAMVEKMRPDDAQFTGFNEFIANALNRITGQDLPPKRTEWRAWLAQQGK